MFKDAREGTDLTQAEAAFRAHIGLRTLAKYEAGETLPPPDVALSLSKEYSKPEMVTEYCRRYCAIGQAMAYEVLDHVDKSLPGVILKLASKMRAADAALSRIMYLAVNKTGEKDFSPEEWRDFDEAIQVFFDVSHNIEVLKEALWKITDVSQLVAEHNNKCRQRGYCGAKEKDRLQAAI